MHSFSTHASAVASSVARLRTMMGTPHASSRSPFALTARDDLSVCEADVQHHRQYFGSQGCVSPVDVVQSGIEPRSYLDRFGPTSCWFSAIQAFKHHPYSERSPNENV